MEKGLTTTEKTELTLNPNDVVENATTQAKLLMDIVEKTHCFQEISGKKYLQVEAWETIGAFNRTHAETESITPILKEDKTIGYQAHVQLWKDGAVVGGAVMPCYFTENCCKGKEGDAKHKASMSGAQTFATSKAYRMNYSYVAILAGYQPLPAEEITEDMKQTVDKSQHWCKEHATAFFMRGKMKSYAHPIKDANGNDTGEWCHERKEQSAKPALAKEPEPEPAPVKELEPEVETTPPPAIETGNPSDVLDESPVTKEDIARLEKMMAETSVSASQLGAYMNKDKGWGIQALSSLKKAQYNELMAAFEKGKQ